jgi:Na+-translocating ferredoxin:NAD+ oxidoreductase subunit G
MASAEGNPFATVLLVGIVAAGAALIVSASHEFSKERIAANQRARLIESLNSVLDPSLRHHDLSTIRLSATDRELLGDDDPIDVFIAIENMDPVAAIFASVAPDGYNAAIRLLIGVSPDGVVTGVRVVAHRETPGLGDRIQVEKSDWILQFDRTTLESPPREAWLVEKDEGQFDSLTGATVTSRAVVKGVKNTLLYFEQHRDELFMAALQQLPSADASIE